MKKPRYKLPSLSTQSICSHTHPICILQSTQASHSVLKQQWHSRSLPHITQEISFLSLLNNASWIFFPLVLFNIRAQFVVCFLEITCKIILGSQAFKEQRVHDGNGFIIFPPSMLSYNDLFLIQGLQFCLHNAHFWGSIFRLVVG
jgi:hypothetical protein